MELEVAGPVKVLIADDHPLVLAGVRTVLERSEGIEIVGEARSAEEVMRMIERRRPQLVLLDLRMPGSSGCELLERIRAEWAEVKVVVLSANDDRGSIDGALRAGASAYIVKCCDPADIASVLRQTACGHVFHAVARGQASVESSEESEAPQLTDRERTILDAVARGMTTAAISKDLWVSEHTVKFHLTNIYRKLEVPNRAGAVRYAVEHGMIAR
jgi:DNA-binding NarL/FixJ family response regulator